MMERIDFTEAMPYSAVESSIHLCRYWNAKQFVDGKNVLDVACGEGYGSFLMHKWGAKSVVGLDVSQEAVDKARRFFRDDSIQFVQGDATALPFQDEQFDMVVSLETIEHVAEPEKFLREIKRVVKSNGIIMLSCPNDPFYKESISGFENPYHLHQYTFPEFRDFSESVLGKALKWNVGLRINGYTNLPMSFLNYPETDPKKPETMIALLDYKESESVIVRQDMYTNYWNSVYYLGIWANESLDSTNPTAVFHPYPCIEPIAEDAAILMRNSIEQYKRFSEEMNTRHHQEMYILGQELGAAEEKRKAAEETATLLKAELTRTQTLYLQQTEISAQQKKELYDLAHEHGATDEKLKRTEEIITELTAKLAHAQEQNGAAVEKNNQTEALVAKLTTELTHIQEQNNIADDKLRQTEEIVLSLTAELAHAQEQNGTAVEKLRQADETVSELSAELNRREKIISEANTQQCSDAEKNRILANENERLKIMNCMIEEEKRCQWEALCTLRDQIGAFQGERAAWIEKDTSWQQEANAMTDQLNRIEHSKVWRIAKHFFGWRQRFEQRKH